MVLIHVPEIKKYKHLNSLMNRHKSNENPKQFKGHNYLFVYSEMIIIQYYVLRFVYNLILLFRYKAFLYLHPEKTNCCTRISPQRILTNFIAFIIIYQNFYCYCFCFSIVFISMKIILQKCQFAGVKLNYHQDKKVVYVFGRQVHNV